MPVQRVTNYILRNSLLQSGDTVIVGVSGGADSTALLNILTGSELNLRLIAVYVDHGLRPEETGAEIKLVQQLASRLHVEFQLKRINVAAFRKKHKGSLEEAARILRYKALEECRTHFAARAIAVAHTADDQVEEFFIRTIRGSGLKGLSGMLPRNGKVIRPLLQENKSTLLKFLKDNDTPHCHDSSNDELRFLRNRVRQQLLPELERDFNPSIRNTILQTTEILREEENLLAELTQNRFKEICTYSLTDGDNYQSCRLTFSIDEFLQEHPAIQRRILEQAVWKMRSYPSFNKIDQLQKIIGREANGMQFHLPNGLRINIYNNTVTFSYPFGRTTLRGDGRRSTVPDREIPAEGIYLFTDLKRKLTVRSQPLKSLESLHSSGQLLDRAMVTFPLQVRPSFPGERIHPLGGPGSKKISRFLSDRKIPPQKRLSYPVLVSDGKVAAILGVQIDDHFKLRADSSEVLAIEWEELDSHTS